MSQEAVNVVRAALDARNAGDMQALRELYDPNVIVRMPDDWPEPGPLLGRDSVMRQGDNTLFATQGLFVP